MEKAPDENKAFYVCDRYLFITKALVYILQHRTIEAVTLLMKLKNYCKVYARFYIDMEVDLLLAKAFFDENDSRWETHLRQAVQFCEKHRFLRPIADMGAAVLPLLEKTGVVGTAAYYKTLLAETRKQAQLYPLFLQQVKTREPLTEAEDKVLALMEKGLDNNAIAQTLEISVSTVKYHASNIYGKFGVKNRTAAVKYAYQNKLLQL